MISPRPEGMSTTDRRRAMLGLFAAVALAATGYISVISVAPLVAEEMIGSPLWSGVPSAVTIGGMALGASLLSAIMARNSRRFGLLLGFVVASIALSFAALAVGIGSFPLFLVAMFIFGAGYGSQYLSRYAAGDLYDAHHRGTAISLVVWAGTVGSIVAPLLLNPSYRLAERFAVKGLVGPFLLAIAASVLTCFLLVLLVPPLPPPGGHAGGSSAVPSRHALAELLARPRVRFALVAMMTGQFVMVLIMSMTPIHIRHAGESLGTVGLVFSAHTLGMFGLSPVTGRLSDRWGRIHVILVGEAMLLAAALMAASSAGDQRWLLVGSLFLLGLGWNFGFVAGSALITESVPEPNRLRIQGLADTIVWSTAATASLAAGFILAAAGYAILSLVGAALVLVPPLVAARYRRELGFGART